MQLTANFRKHTDLGSRAVNTHRLSDRIVLTSLEIRSVRGSSIFCERTNSTALSSHCHFTAVPTYLLQWKAFPTGTDISMQAKGHFGSLFQYTGNRVSAPTGLQCLCRQVMSMIALHIISGILVCDTSLTETFVRTFGAHDPTPRMRKSAPINSRRDLHASSGSIWGLARVFAHESAASSQTTVKVYALDIDIQDCVDVNTQKIITCNDTWTRATRIERVTHEAILISGNEQHCILTVSYTHLTLPTKA